MKYGHEGVTRLLLDKYADIGATDINGQTSLSLAASHGYEASVKLLLDNNANAHTRGDHDQTPLAWAAEKSREMVGHLSQLPPTTDIQQ